jgi:adenylate kinase
VLPDGTSLDAVLNMIVPEHEILERLSKRGRSDDADDTILKRLRIYHETTEPIAEYYRDRGILHDIKGVGSIEDITQRIIRAIEQTA